MPEPAEDNTQDKPVGQAPALVRPYIARRDDGGTDGAPRRPGRRSNFWPGKHGSVITAEVPLVSPDDGDREPAEPEFRGGSARGVFVVVGVAVLMVLAGVVAIQFAGRPSPSPVALPSTDLALPSGGPNLDPPALTDATPTGSPAGASTAAPTTAPASPPGQGSAMVLTPISGPDPTPTPTTPPPPDRTGAITSGLNGNWCLDVQAPQHNFAAVRTTTCDGSNGQTWTLKADGTVRLAGKWCLQPSGSSAVIGSCDGSAGQQWQLAGQMIEQLSGGGCLTVPNETVGVQLDVNACIGADSQQWTVP
jgi:hypothetical protein